MLRDVRKDVHRVAATAQQRAQRAEGRYDTAVLADMLRPRTSTTRAATSGTGSIRRSSTTTRPRAEASEDAARTSAGSTVTGPNRTSAT